MHNTNVITVRQHFPSKYLPTSSFWVYEQVRDLTNKGFSFTVISPQPYVPKFFRQGSKYPNQLPINDSFNGVEVIRPVHLRIPKYKFYRYTNWSLNRVISKYGSRYNAQLIHAHFGNDGIAALKLKKQLKIPLITSFYGYDVSDQLLVLNKFYKNLINKGDMFLALSEDMKKDLINIGFPKNKIHIHHLGINLEEIDEYIKSKKRDKKFTFLIVARFEERKGIHDTINAFYKLTGINCNVELRIVGRGSFTPKLLKLVKKLGIEEMVSFIDNYITDNPRATVLNEMANCDVLLLNSYVTSTGSKEGTPIVLMEAQAMCKPCIGTKHAGIPEIVLDGRTGIIVKERDIEGIYNAMLTMVNNPNLISKFGINGRNHIKKEFNNVIQQKRLSELYLKLIE